MADRLDTSAPHFAAMADRLLPRKRPIYGPWRQSGGATLHLARVYGGWASVRTVKHFILDTSAPHFAAMTDRLLPRSAPAIGHGGKTVVLLRIWHVFMRGSSSARTVIRVAFDTSAPRFVAMTDRLLSQSAPSIGHGGKAGVLPRIWHVFMGGSPLARTVKLANLDTSAPPLPIDCCHKAHHLSGMAAKWACYLAFETCLWGAALRVRGKTLHFLRLRPRTSPPWPIDCCHKAHNLSAMAATARRNLQKGHVFDDPKRQNRPKSSETPVETRKEPRFVTLQTRRLSGPRCN